MNSKPTYVFSSSEPAIEFGRQNDRDKNMYLSSRYAHFNGNKKSLKDNNIIPVHISSTSPQANIISDNEL